MAKSRKRVSEIVTSTGKSKSGAVPIVTEPIKIPEDVRHGNPGNKKSRPIKKNK